MKYNGEKQWNTQADGGIMFVVLVLRVTPYPLSPR